MIWQCLKENVSFLFKYVFPNNAGILVLAAHLSHLHPTCFLKMSEYLVLSVIYRAR